MEIFLDFIEALIYIHEEIFWLKECITIMQSVAVFSLVRWIVTLRSRAEFLIYLSAVIGVATVFLGDMEFWSDNDMLKLLAPTSLFLLIGYKNKDKNVLLFAFLTPYILATYEFYRSFIYAIESIVTHLVIISIILITRENKRISLLISIVVGLLFNQIGYNTHPGTNEILINPALITLATLGLGIYMKSNTYTEFLKSFWKVLLCFAYFGSWIFHFTRSICPQYFYH
ncbi:MAG: hypothetical protein MRJ65_08330 [Candidatus Brocadiaceae bacterium]|nr:hypothetical protein [Candidatus Brocadiaceae bacterium]